MQYLISKACVLPINLSLLFKVATADMCPPLSTTGTSSHVPNTKLAAYPSVQGSIHPNATDKLLYLMVTSSTFHS